MELKLNGKVKLILDLQSWDSGFTKREFVVTTLEEYPQDIKIEVVKDKCALLDTFKVGDVVDVAINLRGNCYNEKYYVNIQGWKINKADGATTTQDVAIAQGEQEADDLPF